MNNKIALITGGSRGLGRSMALHLADHGRDIVLTYLKNESEANEVVKLIESKGRKAFALRLDVSKASSFDSFASEIKEIISSKWQRNKIQFLINNAGAGLHASIEQTTEAQLDEMYQTHLKAPFLLTQKLLPILDEGSRVLNVSSGLTRFTSPGYAAYATMKGAVETLTCYMAKELGSRKISVNTIAPGAIETDFGGGLVRDNKQLNSALAEQTALGRVGLPDDIGGAVAMILADESYWITGQRIEASGGMFL